MENREWMGMECFKVVEHLKKRSALKKHHFTITIICQTISDHSLFRWRSLSSKVASVPDVAQHFRYFSNCIS